MHAVVRYALWMRRAFEKAPNREALVAGRFEEMPEVRRVLERRLDPTIDRSLTTRSVYDMAVGCPGFISWTDGGLKTIWD